MKPSDIHFRTLAHILPEPWKFIRTTLISVLSAILLAPFIVDSAIAGQPPPSLILQITVDQLRGDLPEKYMKNMGSGGVRYLKDQGIWYANAHYGHANTETVVDHTSLASGAVDIAGFGRTFPHAYGHSDHKQFNNYLTFSPAGDELTLDFAKAIIDAEKLGQDNITDFLAISFSSTDYVGHIFGPSSLEAEDNLLRLDRTLADLFAYVDQHIGLKNTLIVLSADHGGPETPAHWRKFGIDSQFVSPDRWDSAPSIARLKKRFGIGQKLIQSFFPPYLYLDHQIIKDQGLELAEVEQAVADELMGIEGVALAVPGSALRDNQLPDTFLVRAALRNYHRKRSGDILVLLQPHYFITDFNGEVVAANHGGPWEYDTFVPVVFSGGNIEQQRIYRAIEPIDIAPTLAEIMKTNTPSGSSGNILDEVVRAY